MLWKADSGIEVLQQPTTAVPMTSDWKTLSTRTWGGSKNGYVVGRAVISKILWKRKSI
jgi:hypothetical protein